MTLKELGKWLDSNQEQEMETTDPKMVALLARVRKSSFFNFFDKYHKKILEPGETIGRRCLCLVCTMGWPEKSGRKYPMFDYENNILKAIEIPHYINVARSFSFLRPICSRNILTGNKT
jgi:hypothetical protein